VRQTRTSVTVSTSQTVAPCGRATKCCASAWYDRALSCALAHLLVHEHSHARTLAHIPRKHLPAPCIAPSPDAAKLSETLPCTAHTPQQLMITRSLALNTSQLQSSITFTRSYVPVHSCIGVNIRSVDARTITTHTAHSHTHTHTHTHTHARARALALTHARHAHHACRLGTLAVVQTILS
jgi:hypothetical protein